MLWGIYSAGRPGFDSAVLRVQMAHRSLFEQLHQHFESLWSSTTTPALWLVKCSRQRPRRLNEPLISELLAVKTPPLRVRRARRPTSIPQ